MTKILGASIATAKQMSEYLLSKNKNPKFSRNISVLEFCQLFLDVCAKEDVRGDIAFSQSCKETGNFAYGGDVKYTQNNFAGLGATGNGVCGCAFKDIETGILAQAQHLKSYATKSALNKPNVDPRRTTWFMNTKGGTSPNVETLGGTWAVSGYDTKKYSSLDEANKAKDSYGYHIVNILNDILKIKVKEECNVTKVIGLDRGHGLKTSGKQTPNGIKEWLLNDMVADKVVELLADYDVRVIHADNDEGNVDESLTSRRTMYVSQDVDAFVSIHHNANTGTWNSATGVEIYTDNNPTSQDVALANAIYKNLPSYTGLKGRGIKKANFTVINQNSIPAVLVEGGFMDGIKDYDVITSASGQLGYAKAVAEGLIEFLGLVKKSNTTAPTTTPTIKPTTTTPTTNSINTGDTVVLSNTPVYASATSSVCSSKKTGTFYIWNNSSSNGRVRITNAKNRVGVSGQVTGWIKLSDIGATVSNTSTSTTTSTATSQKFMYNGLDYSLVFNPTYYANHHSDVKRHFGTDATKLFNHFKSYGIKEGRQASANFNPTTYKNRYVDLRNVFKDDMPSYYRHYIEYGKKEGRSAT